MRNVLFQPHIEQIYFLSPLPVGFICGRPSGGASSPVPPPSFSGSFGFLGEGVVVVVVVVSVCDVLLLMVGSLFSMKGIQTKL